MQRGPLSSQRRCKKGRKSSISRTDPKIQRVKQMTGDDRRLTIRIITDELNIKRDCVWKIITEDLGMKKICEKVVPKLVTID